MDVLLRFLVIKKLEIFFKNPQQDLSSWIPHALFSGFGVLLLLLLLSLPRNELMRVYQWYFIWKSVLACDEIFGLPEEDDQHLQKLSSSVLEFIFNFFGLLLTNADRSKWIETGLIFHFFLSIVATKVFQNSKHFARTFLFCAQLAISSIRIINWLKSGLNYNITEREFWNNLPAKCNIKLIANSFYYYYFFQLVFSWILDNNFLIVNTWWHLPPFNNWTDFQEWIFKIHRVIFFTEWNFAKYLNLLFDEPNKVFGLLAFACILTNSTCNYFQSYLNIPFTSDDPQRPSAKCTAAIFFMAVDDRLWSLPWNSVCRKVFPLYVFIHTSYFLLEFTETVITVWRQPEVLTERQQRRIEEVVGRTMVTSMFLLPISWCIHLFLWDFISIISALLLISVNVFRAGYSLAFQSFKYTNSKFPPFNRHNKRHIRHENVDFLETRSHLIVLVFSTVCVLWMAVSGSYWLFSANALIDIGTRFAYFRKRYLFYASWVMVGNVKPPLPETNEKGSTADDHVCVICHEQMGETFVVTRCGHLYHSPCLTPWLDIKDTCPLCQRLVFKKEVYEDKLDLFVFVREVFKSI